MRKPRSDARYECGWLMRAAERMSAGELAQLPPRTTWRVQSPSLRARPSRAAPAWLGLAQSCVHSATLPIMSYRPKLLRPK